MYLVFIVHSYKFTQESGDVVYVLLMLGEESVTSFYTDVKLEFLNRRRDP
jgi:hypothetical protein